jgi:glycosyltransferase involved in cell wall biosynthesis
MKSDLVSVVVTTKNAARTIAACLSSIREQSYPAVETVVVDNRSADGTVEIARRFADRIIDHGPERSAQRNIGIRAAAGRYVLVIDSDMVLERSVVSSCVASSLATGRPVAIPEVSFGQGYWSRCKALERSAYERDRTVSAARFFEREAVLFLGGYDETLTGGEDWDMSMRAAGSGGIAIASARILHDEGRQTLVRLYLKKKYYGASIANFVSKQGLGAVKKLNPMRASLLANSGRFLLRPHLAAGVACMKAVEFAGLIHGILSTRGPGADRLYAPDPDA